MDDPLADFNCFSDPNSAHILEKFVVHMPFWSERKNDIGALYALAFLQDKADEQKFFKNVSRILTSKAAEVTYFCWKKF